jgi:hypothetical protein
MVFIFSDAPILSAKDRIPVQWTSSGGVAEPNGQVNVVLPDGAGNVYVGGRFTVVGQIKTPYLAKWNGTKWSAVGLPNSQIEEAPFYIRSEVLSLALGPDGSLYVGGYGMTLNGITGRCLLKWDGSAWTDMSGPTLSTTSPSNFVDAIDLRRRLQDGRLESQHFPWLEILRQGLHIEPAQRVTSTWVAATSSRRFGYMQALLRPL